MRLDSADGATLIALATADGMTFTELAAIAKLDPVHAFREADLSGVEFSECDLSGYDFSGADLSDASFEGARIGNTVFARANVTGVRWPTGYHPKSKWKEAVPPLELHPFQIAVVEAIMSAVSSDAPEPTLTLLPPGVGRTAIMAEAFRRFENRGVLLGGLVITETNVARDEAIDKLIKSGLRATTLPKHPLDRDYPEDTIWVGTYSMYQRTGADLMYRGGHPSRISHVMLSGIAGRARKIITDLIAFPTVKVMAFGEITARKGNGGVVIADDVLSDLFPSVAYVYGIDEAIADGILGTSDVVQKAIFGTEASAPEDELESGPTLNMTSLAHDFAAEVLARDVGKASLLIARKIADLDLLTDHVQSSLDAAHEGGKSPFKVLTYSSHHRNDRPLDDIMHDGAAVIVGSMTLLDHADLRLAGLVGITMRQIPDRLIARLIHPRTTAHGLRVIDYGGAIGFAT